ncbi:hypothetical protein [Sphingosinicella sp. BN140058]|uniref:hypothetical protein n=1 Tax=Sphingosinicella sp. BN140058 TaxID=1892855 RepID=UPI0010110B0F|nr:hypothetical protein [Sphingosinicella sp. BN140058]QAY75873.1 hypothetical protein ETR14_04505 [Sphingosinicella sp. BN140058]
MPSRRDVLTHLVCETAGEGAASNPAYALLGRPESTAPWDGDPVTLQQYDSVSMPQTPNGSMMLAYINRSLRNSEGKLAWTSGSSAPTILVAPALALAPTVLVDNWQGNNLTLTNISVGSDTPIGVEAFGPGIGPTPETLPIGPPGVQIAAGQAAQGATTGGYMQLGFQQEDGNPAMFGFIGGPAGSDGNNAYVIAINSPLGNSGPGTPNPAPPGYFATSAGNAWSYELKWPSSVLYVANFGAATLVPPSMIAATMPTITLIRL